MKIGGLLKFSMIDFPGKISAIVFTQGCNLDCGYCHNPELLLPANAPQEALYPEEDVLYYLEKRKAALDGLVITGGEPTLQSDLPAFIAKVKAMGYLVKLDTNGTNPQILKELLEANLLDYVAMDLKAPFEKYCAVCRREVNLDNVKASMGLLINGRVGYEFRTTYDKNILNDEDIEQIRQMLPQGSRYRVQECLPVKPKAALQVEQ